MRPQPRLPCRQRGDAQIAAEVAAEFPDVRWDKELVDARAARKVNKPAALAGSLGVAPIQGSAFDILGKGPANLIGRFWSVLMLLEPLGEAAAARHVMQAIEQVTADQALHTRDLGGTATTDDATNAGCRLLKAG